MDSPIAALFLDHSARKLLQMMDLIDRDLPHIPEDQIWAREAHRQNAAGNLILHLQGNIRQWIIAGLGGAPDIRKREVEFATRGGIDRATLAANLRQTVTQAVEIIRNLPHERLSDRVKPQDHELSVLELIYQCVGHFQQHTGQILLLAKFFFRP